MVHIAAGHGSAASNIHQLAAGLHHMQEYARFILSQGHVGWQSRKAYIVKEDDAED
jgi:hypothetical protein